jgi:hypothetical protein
MTYEITLFQSRFAVQGTKHSFTTQDDLLRFLTTKRSLVPVKTLAECFCPVALVNASRDRRKVAPRSISGICIDVDNERQSAQLTLDATVTKLLKNNLKFAIWSTASHKIEPKYEFADRFRVFIPYSEPFQINEDITFASKFQAFSATYLNTLLEIPDDIADKSAKQITHLQNVPITADNLIVASSLDYPETETAPLNISILIPALQKTIEKQKSETRSKSKWISNNSTNDYDIFADALSRYPLIDLLDEYGYSLSPRSNDRYSHPEQSRQGGQGTVKLFYLGIQEITSKQ